ncbi:MAG: pilus assembly protein PilZ [Treponema sp.]|nr:pilus assembly protein PilZ [Treponema sp.]
MGDNNSEILGKKIFFLYPSAVIQNRIASDLVQQEYEIYIVRNHTGLRRVLRTYPDSIVFVNIDDQLPEKDCETWIRGIMKDPATASVKIGVLASEFNEALERKYINSVGISGGYTVIKIKSDISKAILKIMEILKALDARGRRKYLRVTTEKEAQATLNMPYNGQYINGVIKDISVAGLSCAFEKSPQLEKNTLCKDMQLRLQSMILKTEGIIFGARMDGLAAVYVLLFTQRIDPDVRSKIRKYIQSLLQARMDILLK